MQITGEKNVYSTNNYSEITVTNQKEMSDIHQQEKYRFCLDYKSTRTSVSCRKLSTGPVEVCRGNLANKQHGCLHLPKCIPGLPATTSRRHINEHKFKLLNFILIELF